MRGDPIEGQILMLAGTMASVAPERLPDLVDRAQTALAPELEDYRQRYELAYKTADASYFFVERGHWEDVGSRVGFDTRETDAVRRTHHEQLLWVGRRDDRREEFEAAFDLRECVIIGR